MIPQYNNENCDYSIYLETWISFSNDTSPGMQNNETELPEWLFVEPVADDWLELQVGIVGWSGYLEDKKQYVGGEFQINVRAVMEQQLTEVKSEVV